MTGNMRNGTLLIEQIPDGCRELLLRLPVDARGLGTWCVAARVTNQEGQAVWRLLKVQGSQPSSTEPSKASG